MGLQVFEVNDCEWWAGDCTPAELLTAYMRETGVSHEAATGDTAEYPRPLTDVEMDRLKFVHDDNGNDLETPLTFREQLAHMVAKGETFPCFFATTEW